MTKNIIHRVKILLIFSSKEGLNLQVQLNRNGLISGVFCHAKNFDIFSIEKYVFAIPKQKGKSFMLTYTHAAGASILYSGLFDVDDNR